MSFSPSVLTFFISVALGLILGAIWDCFRIFRKKIGDLKSLVFILDVLYFIIVSILTISFFFFFTYGGFRAFTIVGELLGFILFYSMFEKSTFPLIYLITSIIFKLIYLIYKFFKFSFMKITDLSEQKIVEVSGKISQIKKDRAQNRLKKRISKKIKTKKIRKNKVVSKKKEK